MPRLVRRQSLAERVLSLLNPLDWLLYIYTWFQGYDWDSVQSTTSTPLGLALNILLFISCVNSPTSRRSFAYDDILQPTDGSFSSSYASSGGKFGYIVCTGDPTGPITTHASMRAMASHHNHRPLYQGFYNGSSYTRVERQLWLLSWILGGASILNTIICFTRKKKYRMFESNIDVEPSTPSAKRVRVDSSPSAGILSNILRTPPAESRAHPNQATDVWEISVWDPSQISLRLFALFSPVHVALYFLVFPINSNTANLLITSTTSTYVTVIILQFMLSIQLLGLQDYFTQQARDRAIINKEVFHEYDTKFVHPKIHTLKRDVAVQCADEHYEASVEVYTPKVNRGVFKIMANPAYTAHTSATSNYSGFGTPQSAFQHYKPGSDIPPSDYNTPLLFDKRKSGPLFATATNSNSLSRSRDIFSPTIQKEPESDEEVTGGSVGNSLAFPIRNPSPARRTAQTSSVRSRGVGSGTRTTTTTGPSSARESGDDDQAYHKPVRNTSRPTSSSYSKDTGTSNFPRHSAAGTGVIGMVNMSLENSRSLSPVKMNSPIRRGSKARGSSYAASLGGSVFGTPKR